MPVILKLQELQPQKNNNKLKPPKEILDILPKELKLIFCDTWENNSEIEEIRLRKNKPLIIRLSKDEIVFKDYFVSEDLIDSVLRIISKNSLYALENEFKNGFITIKGGHRVGFVGEAVVDSGIIKTQKNIASINIRVARAVKGCALEVLPYIINKHSHEILHTLIVSPPRCGKTTLLRDLIRCISSGDGISAKQVGLVDERSEIAGCYYGVPQLEVGERTDVLDRCPKDQGMLILVRSMGPDVIATDELGGPKDVEAVMQVVNAGIKFLATVHGDDFKQLCKRPFLKELIGMNIFQRFIFLNKFGTGSWIKEILNMSGNRIR